MLVSLALLCDAVIGNVQEGAIKKYSEGATHVVLYSYSLGFVIILFALTVSNQLIPAASFATQVNLKFHFFIIYFIPPIFSEKYCTIVDMFNMYWVGRWRRLDMCNKYWVGRWRRFKSPWHHFCLNISVWGDK